MNFISTPALFNVAESTSREIWSIGVAKQFGTQPGNAVKCLGVTKAYDGMWKSDLSGTQIIPLLQQLFLIPSNAKLKYKFNGVFKQANMAYFIHKFFVILLHIEKCDKRDDIQYRA